MQTAWLHKLELSSARAPVTTGTSAKAASHSPHTETGGASLSSAVWEIPLDVAAFHCALRRRDPPVLLKTQFKFLGTRKKDEKEACSAQTTVVWISGGITRMGSCLEIDSPPLRIQHLLFPPAWQKALVCAPFFWIAGCECELVGNLQQLQPAATTPLPYQMTPCTDAQIILRLPKIALNTGPGRF